MAFGGSDNVEIKVTADTSQAERNLTNTTEKVDSLDKAVNKASKGIDKSFKSISDAIRNPTGKVGEFGKSLLDTNPKLDSFSSGLNRVASILTGPVGIALAGATLAVFGLSKAIDGLVSVAARGDAFSDVTEAFEKSAKAAGILSDKLTQDLRNATNNTVKDLDLLVTANKLFAAGIDPKVFDDIAAAAKRYADKVNISVVEAQERLTQAIITGRKGFLEQIGTVKDGVLVLDQFNGKLKETSLAQKNVTDIAEQYATASSNLSDKLAKAINESELLKVATDLYYGALYKVKELVANAIIAFIDFTNRAIKRMRAELELLSDGFAVLGNIVSQITHGEVPSLGKAMNDVVAAKMKAAKEATEKTGKAFVKLGKDSEDSADGLKKLKEQAEEVKKIFDESSLSIDKLFGIKGEGQKGIENQITELFKKFNPKDPALAAELKKLNQAIFEEFADASPEAAKQAVEIFKDAVAKEIEANQPGSIFGIEFDGLSKGIAASIESGIVDAFSSLGNALSDFKITADETRGIAVGITESLGASLGEALGGPAGGQIGSMLGNFVGNAMVNLFSGKDSAGTKARKAADKFFADVFDSHRLSVVVGDQLKEVSDLVFNGDTLFGGSVDLGNNNFSNFLTSLPGEAQIAFEGVGTAFEAFLGTAEDFSGYLGAVFANNIGGSIKNLQLLVEAAGVSFEDLGNSIIDAMLSGTISIQQAVDALQGLNDAFSVGVPDKIGAVADEWDRMQAALKDQSGNRAAVNSFRGIGAEARELGLKTLPELQNYMVNVLGIAGNEVSAYIQAITAAGISSLQELTNISNAQLLVILDNARRIQEGLAPRDVSTTIPEAPPANFTTRPTGGGGASSSRGSSDTTKKDAAAKDRKREIQQLADETYRLVTASAKYKEITDALDAGSISRKDASAEILSLYQKLRAAVKGLGDAEAKYEKELEKGNKANKDRLADLKAQIDANQKILDTAAAKARGAGNKLDLSSLKGLLTDLNKVGLASDALGISLKKITDTIVEGFLRGKKSITDVRKELEKTQDLFAQGIPNALGAADQAFQNLIKGGREGGLFSVDAFKDIFAEFDELFNSGATSKRRKEYDAALSQLEEDRKRLNELLSNGPRQGQSRTDFNAEVDALQKAVSRNQKIVDDFFTTPVKAGFEDLRDYLLNKFDKGTVDIFFKALQEQGIASFDEIKNASDDTVVKLLGSLDKLGFPFEATSQDIKNLIAGVDKTLTPVDSLIKSAEGLKSPLEYANDQISKFLATASDIVPVFNDTDGLTAGATEAANQIQRLTESLAIISSNRYTITFDVDAVLSGNAQNLNELLSAADSPDTQTPGLSSPTRAQRRRAKQLKARSRSSYQAFIQKLMGMGINTTGL